MMALKARTALQHAVLGLLLAGIISLVTICFNIIGILSCSILIGLILGASRQGKWHMLALSLLFPAITLGLLEFSKGDILLRARIQISALSWAGFVATYLLGYLVVYLERPGRDTAEPIPDVSGLCAEPSLAAEVVPEPAPAVTPAPLTQEMLQGRWSCESVSAQGQRETKILEIAGDELRLWTTNDKGEASCTARGRVRLE